MAEQERIPEEPKLSEEQVINNINESIDKLNHEEVLDIVANLEGFRERYQRMLMDKTRDIDSSCGYPPTEAITIQSKYRHLYERDPIAARLINIFPDECWQGFPDVYEDESKEEENDTPFEARLREIGNALLGPGYYDPQQLNPLFAWLWRADRVCGIGRYGCILLGVNDLTENDDLTKPLKLASVPGQPPIDNDPAFVSESKKIDPTAGPDLLLNQYLIANEAVDPEGKPVVDTEGKPVTTPRELMFLRILDEDDCQITQWETKKNSPRYMKPTEYQLKIRTPQTLSVPPEQMPRVHWTRVIHIADNLYSDEVLGMPRCQQGYNRLYDMHKLYGGSAEMYWQGAFPGIMFQNLPTMAGRVLPPGPEEINRLKKKLKDYFSRLTRYAYLGNMEANALAPQVSDPTPQINAMLQAICILGGIPMRIFVGSERGELSSSQDMRKWIGVCKTRQDRFITLSIIVPFINRLILAGILPVPKQYYVKWPDLGSLTELEKAQVAVAKTQAMSAYAMGGSQLMAQKDFWTRIMDEEEDAAEEIIEAATEEQAEGLGIAPMGGAPQFPGDGEDNQGGDPNDPSGQPTVDDDQQPSQ